MPALFIFALILGFPVLEAWVLFRLGELIGMWVLVWLVAAAVLGLFLIRFEKLAWALRVANQLRQQRSPVTALLTSARTLVAGVLLIFPGVVSDLLALIVLVWPLPKGRPPQPGSTQGIIEGEFRREDGIDRLPRDRR